MNANAAVVVVTLTIAACSAEPRGVPQSETGIPGRVDSCDLREITGTCLEYTMSELDEWYRENLARNCSVNRRGNLTGIYRQNLRCPKENRVARCEDIVEDPTERYEYDKHYYAGTADRYSWEPHNVRVTCDHVSGHFVPE